MGLLDNESWYDLNQCDGHKSRIPVIPVRKRVSVFPNSGRERRIFISFDVEYFNVSKKKKRRSRPEFWKTHSLFSMVIFKVYSSRDLELDW